MLFIGRSSISRLQVDNYLDPFVSPRDPCTLFLIQSLCAVFSDPVEPKGAKRLPSVDGSGCQHLMPIICIKTCIKIVRLINVTLARQSNSLCH